MGTPFSLYQPTYEYSKGLSSNPFAIPQSAYSSRYTTYTNQQPSVFQPPSCLPAPPSFSSTENPFHFIKDMIDRSGFTQQQEQYLKAIPQYVHETLQSHNNKPSWYHRISAAKNVRVPILQASEITLTSLISKAMIA